MSVQLKKTPTVNIDNQNSYETLTEGHLKYCRLNIGLLHKLLYFQPLLASLKINIYVYFFISYYCCEVT